MAGHPQPYPTPYNGTGGVRRAFHSTGTITCDAGAAYADADTLTVNGIVYTADVGADDAPGAQDFGIAAGDTATQVRDKVIAQLATDPELAVEPAGTTGISLRHRILGEPLGLAGTGGFTGDFSEIVGQAGSAMMPAIIGELRAVRIDDGPSLPEE